MYCFWVGVLNAESWLSTPGNGRFASLEHLTYLIIALLKVGRRPVASGGR